MKSFQLKKGVFTLKNDKLVWVEDVGRYVLRYESSVELLSCGRKYYTYDATDKTLPKLPADKETTLKSLGIHYEFIESQIPDPESKYCNYCEIYDPTVVEWTDFTAQLDRVDEYGDVVERCQQQITSKIPSERMLEAAKKYYDDAMSKIKERQLKEEFDAFFEFESEDGISFYWWWGEKKEIREKIPYLQDKYYFFEVRRSSDRSCIVILKSAIKGKSTLTVKVPWNHVGAAIGRGGENAKTISQDLGLRCVKILPDDEN